MAFPSPPFICAMVLGTTCCPGPGMFTWPGMGLPMGWGAMMKVG